MEKEYLLDTDIFSTYDVNPLFAFGHGLSYTEFKYDNLEILISEETR